jgi:hypothetical protein
MLVLLSPHLSNLIVTCSFKGKDQSLRASLFMRKSMQKSIKLLTELKLWKAQLLGSHRRHIILRCSFTLLSYAIFHIYLYYYDYDPFILWQYMSDEE